MKAHYELNKQDYLRKHKERKEASLQWMRDYRKELKCEICGEDHPATLDFHHKDPSQKDFSISFACKWGYSREKILAEIEKCHVWCSNCHRKHHWRDRYED